MTIRGNVDASAARNDRAPGSRRQLWTGSSAQSLTASGWLAIAARERSERDTHDRDR